jgi:hypothetical protein
VQQEKLLQLLGGYFPNITQITLLDLQVVPGMLPAWLSRLLCAYGIVVLADGGRDYQ